MSSLKNIEKIRVYKGTLFEKILDIGNIKMEIIEKLVPDTSIIIENLVSEKIKNKELKVKTILIHEAVLAELEHQANTGRTIGMLGLDELNKLKELAGENDFVIEFKGKRPDAGNIKHASLGEIDALIRGLALEEDAVLITGDKVQSRVGEAKGMKVIYIEPVIKHKEMRIEKYFDSMTMSVHLKENTSPKAKRGVPGNWDFVVLDDEKLSGEYVQELAKEIIEEAKLSAKGYIEIERRGSSIVQIENYRIVITRPPLSDGWEITIVRPIKKLNLEDYQLSEKLKKRLYGHAEGVLIAGSPGEGKSTFASALTEFYASQDKIVKTIEAPRDLQLKDEVTQYAISHGSSQEIHDILLLSRPDYTVFDEMRNFEDFRLFSDLRLAGIGLAGVVHATNPVDAIQRFLGKTELGIIPQIVDTVIFIKSGKVHKILGLKMVVKVPSGMTEEDLARPVVEIRDFESNQLEFEIYSYGEETTVVPVTMKKETPLEKLAALQIQNTLRKIASDAEVEMVSSHKANVYIPEEEIARVIGKNGETIKELEKRLGIGINVLTLDEKEEDEKEVAYSVTETKKAIIFNVESNLIGKMVTGYANGMYLFNAQVGKKGELRVNKKGKLGKNVINILDRNEKIELMV